MKAPTQRQKEVLDFIAKYIETHAYPPTIRDVAEFFSISVKGASDHITALRKKGLLNHGDNKKSRTLKLVKIADNDDVHNFKEIPILGTVAAGRPIMSVENMDGSIKLHRSFFKTGKDYFALRVRGDSMEGAGIREGDIAVILHQCVVENGEIAVVMVDDGFTLKTFYRESARIRLQPQNPSHHPKYYSRDLQVLGKLVHIIRSYG